MDRGGVIGLSCLPGHDGNNPGYAVHGVEISERIVHSVEPEFSSLAASRRDGDRHRQRGVVGGVGHSPGHSPRMPNPVDRFHSVEIAVSTCMGGESLDEGVVLWRGCPVGVHVFKRERVGGDPVGEIFVAVCMAGDCHPVCWRALPATEVRVARVNERVHCNALPAKQTLQSMYTCIIRWILTITLHDNTIPFTTTSTPIDVPPLYTVTSYQRGEPSHKSL